MGQQKEFKFWKLKKILEEREKHCMIKLMWFYAKM
jgi:hypothetical protein